MVPEEEPEIELIGRLGRPVASWPLVDLPSAELLEIAIHAGKEHGLRWDGEDLRLAASEDQLELLRQSLSQVDAADDD